MSLAGRVVLLLIVCQPALGASYDGLDDWQAVTCTSDLDDLTYSVCAVVVVPTSVTASPTGRVAYAAASSSTSTAYTSMGFSDNSLLPGFTHRSGSVFFSARASTPINDGLPHTIFGVADGDGIFIYVDGQLRGSGSLVGATPSSKGLCTIGALRRTSSTTSHWMGEIGQVVIWDRAVTQEEIAAGCGTAPVVENCHGHTGLEWDPYTNLEVTHFEMERQVQGEPPTWAIAGDTSYCNRPEYTDEDGTIPAIRCERWDLLRAITIPVEGVVYEYRARAVAPDGTRSAPSNVVACGPQDPTTCIPGPCP